MDDNRLAEYADYWGGESSGFLLVSSSVDKELASCLIYHKESRCYEAIDDQDVASEVMKRMRNAGVPIVGLDHVRSLLGEQDD